MRSGDYLRFDWSHHGQPDLLYLPCSNIQEDHEEWPHCSGTAHVARLRTSCILLNWANCGRNRI